MISMKLQTGFVRDNIICQGRYYVYCYRDPFTDDVFYVGKGTGNRLYRHLSDGKSSLRTGISLRHKNPYKMNKIRKILRLGSSPIIEKIYDVIPEDLALDLEAFLITYYFDKGVRLTNMNLNRDNPREGHTLREHPQKAEIIQHMVQTMKERGISRGPKNPMFGKFGPDHPAFGYKHSVEERHARSERMKQTNQKYPKNGSLNSMYGKHHTDETLKLMSDKKLGKYPGAKNPNAKRFKIISPDGIEYIIAGGLARFCKDHKLSYVQMINVHQGKITQWKGWKCIVMT